MNKNIYRIDRSLRIEMTAVWMMIIHGSILQTILFRWHYCMTDCTTNDLPSCKVRKGRYTEFPALIGTVHDYSPANKM